MSKRRYPRLGFVRSKTLPRDKRHECAGCNAQGTKAVEVQFTWMRGEDETYWACDAHGALAQQSIDKFLTLAEAKFRNAKGSTDLARAPDPKPNINSYTEGARAEILGGADA